MKSLNKDKKSTNPGVESTDPGMKSSDEMLSNELSSDPDLNSDSNPDSDRICREIAELKPWFHNLHLPGGIQTAPDHPFGDFPAFKWREIADHIPQDLEGWTALDIGCNAGFYSFELAKRGARVTALDLNEHYLQQARWATAQLGLKDRIELRQMQIYDLAHTDETFDLVLFLGVFYHLRYPMLGLDIVAQKVRKLMLFQTLTIPEEAVHQPKTDMEMLDRDALIEPGWPRMAFIEHKLAGDPTNWWAPNHACVEAILRSSGLSVIGHPGHEIYLCTPDPSNPSCMTTWNAAEYQSAIGKNSR